MPKASLELRTGGYECLTGSVALKLSEVLDEAGGEVLSLLFPLASAVVSVARVEDSGVYAGEFRGHYEVEVRNGLRGGLVDAAVEDSVDDATRVADRDTLARAVPTGVHKVSLGAYFLHLLNEFFAILRGVQAEEGCAEAGREGGRGLGDAAFRAGELSGEAAEEVVLRLLGAENRNGRQHAERGKSPDGRADPWKREPRGSRCARWGKTRGCSP